MKVVKKLKKVVVKAVAMSVSLCLVLAIVNIPAYSAITINSTKTGDGYALQPAYVTPSQAAKQVLQAAASQSIDDKIIEKYGETAMLDLTCLSNVLGVDKSKLFNVFVKTGVTSAQITEIFERATFARKHIDELLQDKTISSVARTWLTEAKKVLNNVLLDTNQESKVKVAAIKEAENATYRIQKTKADIDVLREESAKGKVFSSLYDIVKSAKTNYQEKGVNLIKAISKKYNLDETTVYDKFANNKVTNEQMNIVSSILLKDLTNNNDIFRWQWGQDYKNVEKALSEIQELTKPYKQNLDKTKALINTLLKNANTSSLAKTWLKAAQKVVDGIVTGNQTDAEKTTALTKALKSIQNISNSKATIASLEKESGATSVFSGLQASVLNKSNEYKIYKNAKDIKNTISGMLSKVGELAKSWLKAAQKIVDEIVNGTKTDAEKVSLLTKALKSIKNILSKNATIASLEKESGSTSVFSGLQSSVLNKSNEYKVYKNAKDIKTLISSLSSAEGTSALAKTWLKEAQKVADGIQNGTKTDAEKVSLLTKALKSIKNISN
ncbi:hypothetical protein, partial [Candidatus Ruminimicrobium bovinum]|uniref:hypothetical protein n=1 Tax=Candidatus Ruminimicrobium bovinum TaxID=3242779 RepID=UPI0039B917AE